MEENIPFLQSYNLSVEMIYLLEKEEIIIFLEVSKIQQKETE